MEDFDMEFLVPHCDHEFKWLINYNTGALFNKVDYTKLEVIACPSMCRKCSNHSLSVLYSLHSILTNSKEQSLLQSIRQFPTCQYISRFYVDLTISVFTQTAFEIQLPSTKCISLQTIIENNTTGMTEYTFK